MGLLNVSEFWVAAHTRGQTGARDQTRNQAGYPIPWIKQGYPIPLDKTDVPPTLLNEREVPLFPLDETWIPPPIVG